MAYEKLVLHPLNTWAILHDPPRLLDAIRSAGLIGAAFSRDGEIHHAAGPRFRELILHRSNLHTEERDVHISLLETTEEPAFLGTTDARPPHCPACRSVFSDWKSQLQAWQRDKHHETWRCAKCGKKVEVQKLDWVRSGGIARYSLDLWGIREGVAIPSAELLNLLERLTHHRWSYFYYRLGIGTMGRGHATVQPL